MNAQPRQFKVQWRLRPSGKAIGNTDIAVAVKGTRDHNADNLAHKSVGKAAALGNQWRYNNCALASSKRALDN
jgi:hypothetical protein